MTIQTQIPLLDDILSNWTSRIGDDFEGYKNHVYRMLNICFYLRPDASADEKKKLIIAAAHHDIGIWSDHTVDYLPPSLIQAQQYLEHNGLADWTQEINLIIDEHHKITHTKFPQFPLVELFRRADLVDFSLGLVKHGVPKSFINELKAAFPNAGFHKNLMRLTWLQIKKQPLNPAPMMKW